MESGHALFQVLNKRTKVDFIFRHLYTNLYLLVNSVALGSQLPPFLRIFDLSDTKMDVLSRVESRQIYMDVALECRTTAALTVPNTSGTLPAERQGTDD